MTDNVIPLSLKERLINLGFNAIDVDMVLWQLGPAASLDNATMLLGIIALKAALERHGLQEA
jgi:hypothetical protein